MSSVENSDAEEAHIEYRSIKTNESEWTVFCLDDREPEWWRVIAVFSSEKRAESYAEIEMMLTEDNSAEEIGAIADGVHGHIPALAEPQSNIIRSHFVRRETIDHTHIERQETVTVAARAEEIDADDLGSTKLLSGTIAGREDRSGLTSNDCFLRVLRQMISGPIKLLELDKSRKEGMTMGHIVREGYAEYLEGGQGGLTTKGMQFLMTARAMPEPEAVEQEEPEEATSEPAEDVTLVDPSALPPLTEKQAAIYNGLVDAIKEEGDEKGWVSYSSIERRAQATGATAHLEAMAKKGWVVNRGQFGAPLWTPLTYGKAVVDAPRDSAGRVIRSWTDAELDALKACAETTADYETFGQAVDRTATACEQKARTMGWYRSQGPGRWPQKDEESPAPIPADDFEVDVDDLSKGPREILSIIAELYADKVHPVKEPEILTLSEADEGRLAFILNRLRELRCVQRDGVGSYFPTARGLELAKQIKDEEEAGE